MNTSQRASAVTDLIDTDPFAPHYHFIAPEGICMPFDPNGAIFWKGRYHLFYIFQDPELPHGGHCWGHASSSDLLHWEFHPTALAPAPGDPDIGIFSGNAFVNREGVPTIMYHGLGCGTCIATADDDDLIKWTKSPYNPVIPEPKEGEPGFGVYNVFDPHGWVDGDTYYTILGGKVKPHDLRDTAYLFSSLDLIHWKYERPFYNPNPYWTEEDEDCACPDFFRLGEKHVLVCISHPRGLRYYLGHLDDGTFVIEEHHRMNWPGGYVFAPESLLDGQGGRVMWAWALDQRQQGGARNLGVMTMPRVLSLDAQGRMKIDPPAEFENLRRNHRSVRNLTITGGQELPMPEIAGDVMEIEVESALSSDAVFVVKVRCGADGQTATEVIVDAEAGTITIDVSSAGEVIPTARRFPFFTDSEDFNIQTAPFRLDADEPLSLRFFLDKSVIEVFANSRQCLLQRVYAADDANGLALEVRRGQVGPVTVNSWQLERTNGVVAA